MLLYCLLVSHLTAITFSLYLHRSVVHRSVQFHPVIQHLFRLYAWLTLGVIQRNMMGVHRIHHAKSDTEQDPYNPHNGFTEFYFKKIWMTTVPVTNPEHLMYIHKYAPDAPDDWLESNLYSKYYWLGLVIFMLFNILAWGMIGILIALVPFFTMSMINLVIGGISHTVGYRHKDTRDRSTNIFPIGIIFVGEEMHHNHHIVASSAKFSTKWYEFDLGFAYIYILSKLGLATYKTA